MSIVPRFGINLLINLRGGFVSLYEISKTEYTKRLLVLITLNATNQLATAFITNIILLLYIQCDDESGVELLTQGVLLTKPNSC